MIPKGPRKRGAGSSDPVHELLGVSRVSGPRAILGLGQGDIDADILELLTHPFVVRREVVLVLL